MNAKARVNIPFGRSLTQVAVLPPGSRHDRFSDPFADKKSPWPKLIVFVVLLVFAAFASHASLAGLVPMDKPRDVLVDRTEQILRSLGYQSAVAGVSVSTCPASSAKVTSSYVLNARPSPLASALDLVR